MKKHITIFIAIVLLPMFWNFFLFHPICRAADKPAQKVSHRFIANCFRNGKIVILSRKGEIQWEYPARCVQDTWVLPNGNILFSYLQGAKEVTRDKKIVWEYKETKKVEIHSCQPLPNGNVLIGECGASRLIEVDRKGRIKKQIKLSTTTTRMHMQFRNCRKTVKGTYLVAFLGESLVKELDGNGKILHVFNPVKDLKNKKNGAHAVIRLKNGNTLISTGYCKTVVEMDPNDKVVWQLSRKDLPAGFNLHYLCGLQRLPNGNTVIANYSSTPQFFEVTRNKKVVWKINDSRLGAVSGHFILDVKGDVTKGEILR